MRSAKYIQKLKTINRVQKASTPGERVISSLFPNRTTSYGWDQNVAEQVAHFRNWTYVAVNAICCRMGGLFPNLAYVVDAEKPGLTVKGMHRGLLNAKGRGFGGSCTMDWAGHSYLTMGEWRSKALSVIKPHDDLEPMGNDHPLRRLLENPNPVDTTFDLLYESQMFQELCGVSYIWAVPNSLNGTPCELWVIPTHWVWPRTGGGLHVSADHPHAGELIEYYEVRPWGGAGASGLLKFPPNEIIMERWKSPQNKIGGWSKLTAGSQWIDTEESISRSRWAQFINQARPEFWLELAQGYEDPDDNMIARIESKFMSRMQGEGNYGKPVITPPGAKITPLSFSPTEMAYFSCLSADSECLTDNGWKKYTEITKETKIACFNQETKCLEYHRPSAIHINPYSGVMHRWESDGVDALITPNHRVYVKESSSYVVARVDTISDDASFFVKAVLQDGQSMVRAERGGELSQDNIYSTNVHSSQRSKETYNGIVWCVTVPTGLFVVRRNGKVHVTGNSEEQIRDMILSLFQVPKAAVGISDGLTFGSVLATLASMCSQCINPRLQMRGQTLTKHLASRWSQPGRRAKLWWDDTTPADPAQVNSDIQCDLQGHAISPNEIRALRGRPSYEHGGDDPLVSGPGGIVPLPLNTGEDQQDLADLLKPFTQPEQAEQQAMEGGPLELPEGGEEEQPLALESKPLDMDAGVEEPNGEPSKRIGKVVHKSTADAAVGDLSKYLSSLPEEHKEGLYVWVNQGPPKLAIVDFMDWFDGDAGVQQDIKSQASKWTGDEQRVIVQNEGGKPGPEWQQVFPNKYDKAIEFSTEKELNAYLKKNNLVRKSVVASGLAVIARDTGRVLMLQRHIDDHRGGTWEFPGGKIEGNGDPLESAKREWFEETGIELPDGKIVDNWRGTNGKYEGFVYQVAAEDTVDIVNRRLDTNPDGDVFEVVAWVSPKDFDNHNLRPELLADLEHLQRATQNKSFKVSNSLKYIAKYAVRKADGGSCKPGERADLTGCTPINGSGGKVGSVGESKLKSPKIGSSVTVDGGKHFVEPLDGDDTFPPTIASYKVQDGYLTYVGRNGSEGVVSGTSEEISKWVKEVDKLVRENPPEDAEVSEWTSDDGGKELIQKAESAAIETASIFGLPKPKIQFGVRKADSGIGGEAGHDGVEVINAHKPSPSAFYFKPKGVTQGMQIASHEVAHQAYTSDPELGKEFAEKLSSAGSVSLYGSIAGKLENLMEAAAAYVTAPDELKSYSPEIFNVIEDWSKKLRERNNVGKSNRSGNAKRKGIPSHTLSGGGSGPRTIDGRLQHLGLPEVREPSQGRKGIGILREPSVPSQKTKAEGSCKPGERADLTGCTPISGGGGAKTTETPSSAGKVKTAIVDNFKAAAEKFSDVKETMLTLGEIGGSVLPESVQTALVKTYGAVRYVEHKLMTGYNKSREMAETVAIERGLGEEHAKMVGKAVGIADLAVGWTIQAPAILALTGGNVAAAKVGTWIPACSLGYIVYSTARNPMATIRAAKKMLSSKKEEPKKSKKTARKPAKKKVKK